MFIHDAILEACLCGETAIPVNEFALTYKEMLKVDSQSNTSQLREEFQVIHANTPFVFKFERLYVEMKCCSNHSRTILTVQLQFSLYASTQCAKYSHLPVY